jgi:hypothetical protein
MPRLFLSLRLCGMCPPAPRCLGNNLPEVADNGATRCARIM